LLFTAAKRAELNMPQDHVNTSTADRIGELRRHRGNVV